MILATVLALQAVPASAGEPAPFDMPPSAEQVLAIPEELQRDFHKQVLNATRSPEQRLNRLAEFMFDEGGLGLKYMPNATHTITEAYGTRQVNCLSFTLLFVILAREAGLQAYGQQIDRVLAWGLTGDVVMQSMHANAVVTFDGRKFMADIAADGLSSPVANFQVDDEQLLALFYSNRAMELLTTGHAREAQAWLDVALVHSPDDATLLNNAGVLSQRRGDAAAAETSYLRALAENPRLTSAYSNLIALYRAKGDSSQATYWQQRAGKVLRKDPYYQFALGRQQEQSGDFTEAVGLYRRAIRINDHEPLFHFGLARAYSQLGQSRRAGLELSLARDLSGKEDQVRYQAKLDALYLLNR
ncbi:MAG: tetratricopeptide repeat protein [Thermomonas sp.]